MTRRRYVQMNGELVEVPLDWRPDPSADFHVMGDIEPYRSMVDGSIIAGRAQHRAHLRQHGCIEVGNDSSLKRTTRPPLQSPPGLKETYARQVYEKLRY